MPKVFAIVQAKGLLARHFERRVLRNTTSEFLELKHGFRTAASDGAQQAQPR